MTFHYEHQGFCPCCETPQTFTTDSDWFRDTLCCPNCGSVPRERAIALVLNGILPDWRALGRSRTGWLQYHVPASETKDGKELLRTYYEAFGRFVQMFAEVEKVIAQTLWAYAGTKAEVAKIIFAGTQSDTASGYIKAVAKATKASDEALIARRRIRSCAGPSFDLQHQRDEFALAMCVGLGKNRFQLIARRLPRNLQF